MATTRKKTVKSTNATGTIEVEREVREPVVEPEHGQDATPWGCICGWRPNYNHAMGLAQQQQRHFEHGGFTRDVS